MGTPVVSRQKYRSVKSVKWLPFIFWMGVTFCIALAMAEALNWFYSIGHYYLIMPFVCAGLLIIPLLMAITKGKCRMPLVAGLAGLFTAVFLYGGYLYFGMLSLLGPSGILRFDLLPNYILLRMHTDVERDLGHPSTPMHGPDSFGNGLRMCIEAGCIVPLLTLAGYRRSKRAFCDKCDAWKQQHVVTFAPGYARQIAQWVDADELANLSTLQRYVPTGKRKQSTMVAIECCNWDKSEDCPVYLAVKEVSNGGGFNNFDGAFGKTTVSRVELFPDEIPGLGYLFPQLRSRSKSDQSKSASAGSSLIEVQSIPPNQANQILTMPAKVIGNIMSVMILPLFWGSLAGIFGCLYQAGLSDLIQHNFSNPLPAVCWIIGAIACIGLTALTGFIGLKNSGVGGNLYFRHLARKAIASRASKFVDPARPGDLPLYFVQVVPRKNWGVLMLESATDTGFLQIDPSREEIRFEGDVERYRIPFSAITSCSVVPYSSSAGSSSVQYWMVMLEGNTPTGKWEAPISNRQTKWLVPANHRQQWAEMIVEQITPYLTDEAELIEDDTDAPVALNYAALKQSDITIPPPVRTNWLRSNAPRLVIFVLAIGLGVFRGISNSRNRARLANLAHEVGGGSPNNLPLTISNIRSHQQLIKSPPYYGDSGNWTVFDCAEPTNPAAKFTVAVESPRSSGNSQFFRFANAAILPGDRDAGAQILVDLAKALHQSNPADRPVQPLQTFKMPTAILGQQLSSPAQGLKANSGSWVATKWFIQNDGLDAELYFDYDLTNGRAELSEKDAGYDADVLLGLATALRDGPPPERSSKTDPDFTEVGPVTADPYLIPNSKNCIAHFEGGGKMLTITTAGKTSVLTGVYLDHPQQMVLLAKADGFITTSILADPDGQQLVIAEMKGNTAGFGTNAEQQIWWIDRTQNTRHQITGPWGDHGWPASDKALSPDSRYIAIGATSGTILDKDRKQVLYLVNTKTGSCSLVQTDGCYLQGWVGSGNQLRACIATGNQWERSSGDQSLLADPTNGKVTAANASQTPAENLSPDQRQTFTLHIKNSVDVTEVATGQKRTFTFSADDRKFAEVGTVRWLDSRYLEFDAARSCFIDTSIMKLGYLPVSGSVDQPLPLQFSPDFKWAISSEKAGISLSRIVTPVAATQPSQDSASE